MGEQFEEILEQLDVNIYMTDINTHRILFMNQKMKKEYGVENPEGQLCWQVLQEGAKGVCKVCKIPELMRLGKENQVICWRENNSKVKRTFENFDSLVRWGGRLVHMQQSYDITNILQLSESASKDSLCGVWNREKGKSMLAECAENLEEGHSWLVALLDVDNLKTVNDTYGHQEGDFLLQRLCQVIQGQLQKTDFMFRLSGDEFVVVMKDVPEKEGVKRFRAWRELVEQEGARTQPLPDIVFLRRLPHPGKRGRKHQRLSGPSGRGDVWRKTSQKKNSAGGPWRRCAPLEQLRGRRERCSYRLPIRPAL